MNTFWQTHRIKSASLILLALLFYLFWGWQQHHFFINKHRHALAISSTTPLKLAATTITKTTEHTYPYTLQIMSGLNTQAMQDYIKQHHLEKLAKVMKTQYKGHDWFILTYGHYDELKQAKQAMNHMNNELKSHHPWIRPTKQLHLISGPNANRSIE